MSAGDSASRKTIFSPRLALDALSAHRPPRDAASAGMPTRRGPGPGPGPVASFSSFSSSSSLRSSSNGSMTMVSGVARTAGASGPAVLAVSRERPRQVRLARQRGFEEERVGAQVSVQHRVPRHVAGLAPLQVRVARVRHVARPVGKAASERRGRMRGNGAVRDGGERTTRPRRDATPRGAHRSIGSVSARARRDSRTGRKPPRESDARSWSMARGGRAKVDARRASSNRRRARERPARRGVEWRGVIDRLPPPRTKVLYPTCPSRAFPAG